MTQRANDFLKEIENLLEELEASHENIYQHSILSNLTSEDASFLSEMNSLSKSMLQGILHLGSLIDLVDEQLIRLLCKAFYGETTVEELEGTVNLDPSNPKFLKGCAEETRIFSALLIVYVSDQLIKLFKERYELDWVEIFENQKNLFDKKAEELLSKSHKGDRGKTKTLLTEGYYAKIANKNSKATTLLEIADRANAHKFLALPCVQRFIDRVWVNGMDSVVVVAPAPIRDQSENQENKVRPCSTCFQFYKRPRNIFVVHTVNKMNSVGEVEPAPISDAAENQESEVRSRSTCFQRFIDRVWVNGMNSVGEVEPVPISDAAENQESKVNEMNCVIEVEPAPISDAAESQESKAKTRSTCFQFYKRPRNTSMVNKMNSVGEVAPAPISDAAESQESKAKTRSTCFQFYKRPRNTSMVNEMNCVIEVEPAPISDAAKIKERKGRQRSTCFQFYKRPRNIFVVHTLFYLLYMVLYGLFLQYMYSLGRSFENSEINWKLIGWAFGLIFWQLTFIWETYVVEVRGSSLSYSSLYWNYHRYTLLHWIFLVINTIPLAILFICTMLYEKHRIEITPKKEWLILWYEFFFYLNFIYTSLRSLLILTIVPFFGTIIFTIENMFKTFFKFAPVIIMFWLVYSTVQLSLTDVTSDKNFVWAMFIHGAFELVQDTQDETKSGSIQSVGNVKCPDETQSVLGKQCFLRRGMAPVVLFFYIMGASVLVINILTTLINKKYDDAEARASHHWNSRKLRRTMLYQRSHLPPPFNIFVDFGAFLIGLCGGEGINKLRGLKEKNSYRHCYLRARFQTLPMLGIACVAGIPWASTSSSNIENGNGNQNDNK
ncbi:unnamed protein product, partial [Mesorhabditis belari]|uniref:Ion transport domain-containing protein n=1 Tax=Mesorhabditis belari TaxID=2138241 RepID=A0AAF3F9K5_9BILA